MARTDNPLKAGYTKKIFYIILIFSVIYILLCLTFLLIQPGDESDESEHCHTAWMMGTQNQVPMQDFFQHHNPLIWDMLKIYYEAGGTGIGVFYFGRILVLISFLGTCLCIFKFGKQINQRRSKKFPLTGFAGIFLFGLSVLLFAKLFVIRPETFGVLFIFLSIIIWCWEDKKNDSKVSFSVLIKALLSGIFFSVAIYFSPRYILLSGIFLLFPQDGTKIFTISIKRLLAFACGFAAFIVLYTIIMGYDFSYLYFNIEFTSILSKTGEGKQVILPVLIRTYGVILFIFIILIFFIRKEFRKKYTILLIYLAIVFVLSYISGYPYLFIQNFSSGMILITLISVFIEVNINWKKYKLRLIFTLLAILPIIFGVLEINKRISSQKTLFIYLNDKQKILETLSDDDKVLLRTMHHPVCANDLSYYGIILGDYPDRLCTAVRKYNEKSENKLPECNIYEELNRNLPKLIDAELPDLLCPCDKVRIRNLLDTEYQPTKINEYILQRSVRDLCFNIP